MNEMESIVALSSEELKTITGGQGCGIDPNGATTSATAGDNGCGIDPNGHP